MSRVALVLLAVAGLMLQLLLRPAKGAVRPDALTLPDGTPHAYNASGDQIVHRVMADNEKKGIADAFPGLVREEFNMLLKSEQAEQLYSKSDRGPRQKRKVNRTAKPWSNGVLNFLIDPWEYSGKERAVMYLSMAEWSQKTCIKFKPATAADADKVMFLNGIGCNSQLGMVGGEQALNLQAPGCRYRGLYLHEVGHALGLVHEHQLPERDEWVDIIMSNVKPEWQQWFNKYPKSDILSFGIEYNVRSIMHYGITAFSKDDQSQTIRAKPRAGQTIEDTHLNELAFSDIKAINQFYNCSANCPAGITCSGAGFVSKDCKCYCPDGTSNCQIQPKIPVMKKLTCSNEAKDADCDSWAKAKECAYNPLYMQSKCRRSCDKCEPLPETPLPPKMCDNVAGDDDCAGYARTGECYTSAAWMYLNCTAACGMCQLRASKPECVDLYPDSSQCQLWKNQNMCDRKPWWMYANCRKTCGVCGQKTEGCSNKLSDDECYARATTGECQESFEFMSENCAKACGRCGTCFNNFPNDDVCLELAAKGECANSWEWTGVKCIKACRLCDGWPPNQPRLCMDLNADCAKWAAEGECQANPAWMISNCQKSCSRCDCVDRYRDSSTCNQWASQGECSNNPAWMIENCQKSCGACTNAVPAPDRCRNVYTDSAKCDSWAASRECEVNPRFMIPNCRKSCTGCAGGTNPASTTTATPVGCINKYGKDDECDAWAKSGECKSNPVWMQVQCARSCSQCGAECKNTHTSEANCTTWAAAGECAKNPKWMLPNCMKACGGCAASVSSTAPSRVSPTTAAPVSTAASSVSSTQGRSSAKASATSTAPVTRPATVTWPGTTKRPVSTLLPSTAQPTTSAACRNIYSDSQCRNWKLSQQCARNPMFMIKNCYRACSECGGSDMTTTTSRVSTTASRVTTASSAATPSTGATASGRPLPVTNRLSTPVAAVITTAMTSPTSSAAPEVPCLNAYNDKSCEGWAKAGHCLSNSGWMLKYCYKACRNCSPGEAEGAATWGSWGNYGPCSKTCGGGNRIRVRVCSRPGECTGQGGVADTGSEVCNTQPCSARPTSTPPSDSREACSNEYGDDRSCDAWAFAGQCEADPLWMGAFCARSCHNCLRECRDVLEDDCPAWAAANECRDSPWMRHNCHKSCTSCSTVKALAAPPKDAEGIAIVPDISKLPQLIGPKLSVTESPKSKCRNIYSDKTCERLALGDSCLSHPGAMRLFCSKACGCPEPDATWSSWSRWSSCSRTCYSTSLGSGVRLRSRSCSDSRQTCPGKNFMVEPCRQTVVCRGN